MPSTKPAAAQQDGILARLSKKLVSDEALLTELGSVRLDRELQKYIWNSKDHISLKDLWEYLNRYTYLPRLKGRQVLQNAVLTAVSGILPGVFAYAERWDEASGTYLGLIIEKASNAQIVIDSNSVILRPEIAEAHRPQEKAPPPIIVDPIDPNITGKGAPIPPTGPDRLPTQFHGVVMISPERPAREIHKVVENIIEQLTVLARADVSIKLEINADVPGGLDSAKVRTLIENATTLNFVDKKVT